MTCSLVLVNQAFASLTIHDRLHFIKRFQCCFFIASGDRRVYFLDESAHHGYVIDFVDFYINDWHYPIFNIADAGICIGALLIVLEGFFVSSEKKKAEGK